MNTEQKPKITLDFYSIANTRTEWFDGMVEAAIAVTKDETAYIICHEDVVDKLKELLGTK